MGSRPRGFQGIFERGVGAASCSISICDMNVSASVTSSVVLVVPSRLEDGFRAAPSTAVHEALARMTFSISYILCPKAYRLFSRDPHVCKMCCSS